MKKKKKINSQEVIIAMTEGIGARLGKEVRLSYFSQLERLEKIKRFDALKFSMRQSVADLLAISVLYQKIISPLESGSNVFRILEKSGADHIRMGSDKLTKKFAGRTHFAIISFSQITTSLGVTKDLLSYSTLEEFVKNAEINFRFKNEDLDRS